MCPREEESSVQERMAGAMGFFDVLSRLWRETGMSQGQLCRRINEQGKQCALYAYGTEMSHTTLSRALRGEDLPSTVMTYRIARFGFALSEEECLWLERLRLQEDWVHHHSTTQHRIMTQQRSDPLPTPPASVTWATHQQPPTLPAWILEEEEKKGTA